MLGCRLALLTAAALALVAPSAHAWPGGSLSGEIGVEWTSDPARAGEQAWSGAVALALEPGAAATESAAAALRASGRTYRDVRTLFLQSSRIDALRMSRFNRYAIECVEGESFVPGETRYDETITGVTQALVPLSVDLPYVDLLRGNGHVEVELYTDNRGLDPGSETYPFPEAGGYFMPLPGIATASASDTTCGEVRDRSGERAVFSTQGDATVPFAFAEYLNEAELPLVLRDGAWVVEHTETQAASEDYMGEGALALAMTYRLRLTLHGSLRAIRAQCRVPTDRQLRRVRSPRQARALFRRAGFPRAKYLGRRPMLGGRPGRIIRDPGLTSSGFLRCGSRARFLQMARWRG